MTYLAFIFVILSVCLRGIVQSLPDNAPLNSTRTQRSLTGWSPTATPGIGCGRQQNWKIAYWGLPQQNTIITLDKACDNYDAIVLSFLSQFGSGRNLCMYTAAPTQLGAAIQRCQARGKLVLLGIGGGQGFGNTPCGYTFSSTTDATATATAIFDAFVGNPTAKNALQNCFSGIGQSYTNFQQPANSPVILDGFVLDLECPSLSTGQQPSYVFSFWQQLSHLSIVKRASSKYIYLGIAPTGFPVSDGYQKFSLGGFTGHDQIANLSSVPSRADPVVGPGPGLLLGLVQQRNPPGYPVVQNVANFDWIMPQMYEGNNQCQPGASSFSSCLQSWSKWTAYIQANPTVGLAGDSVLIPTFSYVAGDGFSSSAWPTIASAIAAASQVGGIAFWDAQYDSLSSFSSGRFCASLYKSI